MHGIEVLYWALSILFCLAMAFAILLWCRSWRREEREATARQLQGLSREVARLSDTVEMLEHTFSSLQTADEQFTRHIEDLRKMLRSIPATARPEHPQAPLPRLRSGPAAAPETPAAETDPDTEDRYARARVLLQNGQPPGAVARTLDLGNAEVQMIARMINQEKTPDDPGTPSGS